MIVQDLSPEALVGMPRFDLANAAGGPPAPAGEFAFNECAGGVSSFIGTPPWELHEGGDELIHVLAGSTLLTVRQDGADVARTLNPGDLAVVPRGCWHRNAAPDGVTLFHLTPREGTRNSWDDPKG